MTYSVKLLKKERLTHDVLSLSLERPDRYGFTPGQFLEFSLEQPGRPAERAALSFTGRNSDPELHVVLKTHAELEDLAARVRRLEPGATVQISEPKDEVHYRGPGIFIAGGTGIAPFMAIFRQLHAEGKLDGNWLLFVNKRGEDICFEGELRNLLGNRFISVLALEDRPRNIAGTVDAGLIRQHFPDLDRPFYVCGPAPFVNRVAEELSVAGVKRENVACYC